MRLRPSGVLTNCPASLWQPLLHPLLCRTSGGCCSGPLGIGDPSQTLLLPHPLQPLRCDQQPLSLLTSLYNKVYFLLVQTNSARLHVGCCRYNYTELDYIGDKTCPVSFPKPTFIKGELHKCLLPTEYSSHGEHSPFWGGCFKVLFSIYKPPTYFSSGSHQGHPQIIRQKWVQHRRVFDNLWEAGYNP